MSTLAPCFLGGTNTAAIEPNGLLQGEGRASTSDAPRGTRRGKRTVPASEVLRGCPGGRQLSQTLCKRRDTSHGTFRKDAVGRQRDAEGLCFWLYFVTILCGFAQLNYYASWDRMSK